MVWEVGIISLLFNAVKDLIRVACGLFKKTPPEKIITHRQKWKKKFELRVAGRSLTY